MGCGGVILIVLVISFFFLAVGFLVSGEIIPGTISLFLASAPFVIGIVFSRKEKKEIELKKGRERQLQIETKRREAEEITRAKREKAKEVKEFLKKAISKLNITFIEVKNINILAKPEDIENFVWQMTQELRLKRLEYKIIGYYNEKDEDIRYTQLRGHSVWVEFNVSDIINSAIIYKCKGIVSVHNHPSNIKFGPNLSPSIKDWVSAYSLYKACKQKNIKFYGAYITSVDEYKEYFYSIVSAYQNFLQESFIQGDEKEMAEWSSRYWYNDSNVDLYAPTSGGVYRLIYKNNERYYIFYVGQSDNLKRRLHEHLSPSEPDECIKRHLQNYSRYFRFIEISSQTERDKVEKEEIEEYKPSCNG